MSGGFGFWAALELMLTLAGQVLSFCSKPIVAQYRTRVDGIADFQVARCSCDRRTACGRPTAAIDGSVPVQGTPGVQATSGAAARMRGCDSWTISSEPDH